MSSRRASILIALGLSSAWLLFATLPYLGDYPIPGWSEMGIAAPAYKLASQGVYGNDLFTGFYGSEERNYEYMPAYPLLVAASFAIVGPGMVQARAVSVACALLVVLLTYAVGRRLFDAAVGVVAAALLVGMRLGLVPGTSGVPLLDFARDVRYDILVPVFVLASSLTFLAAMSPDPRRSQPDGAGLRRSGGWLFAAGVLAGLATLAHVYGAFILAPFAATILLLDGSPASRLRSLLQIAVGWLVAMLPWALYVARDWQAYLGQMSRHEGRFDVLSPSFYLDNLMREVWRYGSWSGGSWSSAFLQPRVGIWLFLLGAPAATVVLWRRARAGRSATDLFILSSLPTLALLLGLLIDVKRYVYVLLLLPFISLFVAVALVETFRRPGRLRTLRRAAVVVVGLLAALEAGAGVAANLRAAAATTPYREVASELRGVVPAGARVLLSQTYWLAFADYETRSINLALQLSRGRRVADAMADIAAGYMVVETYFLDPDSDDPRVIDRTARFFPWFHELAAFRSSHCPTVLLVLDDSHYGEIAVYRCSEE